MIYMQQKTVNLLFIYDIMYNIEPIAIIYTDFSTKFGIPRQSNIISELKGRIIFEKKYRNPDAVRGLEQYSHLWLLWQFSENVQKGWSPTVRPPILGGNERIGVFATRSSFRPNNIALSCVKLDSIYSDAELGPVITVSGIDMMNKTPVFDIKPYIPKWDSKPGAIGGFTQNIDKKLLEIHYDEDMLFCFSDDQKSALLKILEQDPRPAYQNDPERIYGFEFAQAEIKFCVIGEKIYIKSVTKI